MSKIYYNKLVRNKIPEIMDSKEDLSYACHVASQEEFTCKLQEKLLEEVNEFVENPCIEELADIYEVLNQVIIDAGLTFGDVIIEANKKSNSRGTFSKGIILEYTVRENLDV